VVGREGLPQLAAGAIRKLGRQTLIPLTPDGHSLHLLTLLLIITRHLHLSTSLSSYGIYIVGQHGQCERLYQRSRPH